MINKYYNLDINDFKRAFQFGTDYYIYPSKNTIGRTTAEPRGLGSILDAFTLGKLTEIGVEKILTEANNNKGYALDFAIKSTKEVENEPDIVKIIENGRERKPNLFIEIKNTSDSDRWIGITEEQFNTIKRSAGEKEIYLIYASIHSKTISNNPKTADLTGMFLKEIENKQKSEIFQVFANLNAKCKIEFVLSAEDLKKYSFPFEKGMNIYETSLFKEKKRNSVYTASGQKRKDILKISNYNNYNSTIEIKLKNEASAEKKELSIFKINGSFNLITKEHSKLIECLSDVKLSNEIFGEFCLKNGKIYDFNLNTIGRDPKLKRNNLFISKHKIYQLIKTGKIENPMERIIKISNII